MSVSEMNVGQIRRSLVFMRAISCVVLITFASVTISPGAQAIAQTVENANTTSSVAAQQLADERGDLGKALGKAKQQLRVIADLPDVSNAKPTAAERAAKKEELKAWREELRRLDSEVRAEFDSVGAMISEKKLPDVIKARHAEALAKYKTEKSALDVDVDAALESTDEAVVKAKAEAAYKRLNATQLGRSQQEFDPNNLPNSSLKPDRTRVPKTTPEEFQSSLLLADPTIRLAQTNGLDLSQLPGASDPNYLAATTEVVLTDDIKAKAEELHRNPVEIYNWVRNNVHWQPTWGAIQDASHTLSAQRGNAFDIASLTIALLRASGIPARYVHGTIDVPDSKFRNWAGGFQYIDAAIDFASAGGIPITAVTSGGKITKVRMEHIWVEAAVDFKPSRGAKNRVADTWVAMDASYKQLQPLPGLDVAAISGLDAAALLDAYSSSGDVNEAEGWATGFDQSILSDAQAQARDRIRSYVDQHAANATYIEVIGGYKIANVATPVLSASLASPIVTIGARFAKVPASLQQRITFAFGRDLEGEPINPRTFTWALFSSKQATLSFRPATSADAEALRSFLPEGAPPLEQWPTSVPAYLLRVVPELRLDDEVVMTGPAMTLGQDLTFVFAPAFAGREARSLSYTLPAGSYLAVAVAAGSVSPSAVAKLHAQFTATEQKLISSTGLETITSERLLGDQFHLGLLSYYAQYTSLGYSTQISGGHHALAAGLGTLGYEPQVDSFFGVPRTIRQGGIAGNIPIVNIVRDDSADPTRTVNLTFQLGAMSSFLEHVVPEQLLGSAGAAVNAISAVKAIAMASAAGQRIYRLTPQNQASTLPLIHHDPSTMAEISAALATGKYVITHTDAVAVPGWSGAGYVIIDPETGAGAWKIGGGANGLFIYAAIISFFLVAIGAYLVGVGAAALALLGLSLSVGLKSYIDRVYDVMNSKEFSAEKKERVVITMSVIVVVLNLFACKKLVPAKEVRENVGPVLLSLIGTLAAAAFNWVTELFLSLPHMQDRPRVPDDI